MTLKRCLQLLIVITIGSGVPVAALAQSYGQGVYSSCDFNNGTCGASSLLPGTGAHWLLIGGIAVIAIGVLLFILAERRRRAAKNQPTS